MGGKCKKIRSQDETDDDDDENEKKDSIGILNTRE